MTFQMSTGLKVLCHSSVKEALPKALEEARAAFQEGDKSVLMAVVFECALYQAILPDWAVDGLLDIRARMGDGQLADWNAAFGMLGQARARTKRSIIEQHTGTILMELAKLRLRGFSLGSGKIFVEAAARLRKQGIPINQGDVKKLYRSHGQFAKTLPKPRNPNSVSLGILHMQIPLTELRRSGRRLWED